MIAKKENLEKLLLLVKQIALDPEHEWFKTALLELGDATKIDVEKLEVQPQLLEDDWGRKIDKMEKHLKIDGFELIDYSRVQDEKLRAQLTSDCIEMSRYRLGKVKEGISFEEFCRYAFYQIEALLNYFYLNKFESLDEVKSFLLKGNSLGEYRSSVENANSIDEISFSKKFFSFYYGFVKGKSYLTTINFNLRTLRNDVSHRGAADNSKEEEVLRDALLLKGMTFMEMTESQKATFNEGRFIEFRRKKDFQHVLNELSAFTNDILENLAGSL